MGSLIRTLSCGLALLGVMLLGTGVALAGGGSGCNSASNCQYVDPLGSSGSHHRSHSSSQSASSSTTSTTSSSSGAPSSSSSTLSPTAPSGVGSSGSSSGTSHKSGRALPFTGLNLWACVALGCGLLASGFALRRSLARGR